MSNQEIVHVSHEVSVRERAQDFLPVFDIQLALERKRAMQAFIGQILIAGSDYGIIPGTDKKTLLKPGAEKLSSFFGLAPEFIHEKSIEDWHGDNPTREPFFYFRVKCRLHKHGRVIGEGDGACSSWESKYRYRWISEDELDPRLDKSALRKRGGTRRVSEFDFAIERAETGGKYGKPAEYWQRFNDAITTKTAKRIQKDTKRGPQSAWEIEFDETQFRVPNPDIADQVNTILKMAEKRALVAAVLIATNASDSFTQDVEDFQPPQDTGDIDTGGHPIGTQEAQNYVRDRKLAAAQDTHKQQRTGGQEVAAATAAEGETSGGNQAERREIPPASTHGSEISPNVQAVWLSMGTKISTIVAAFTELKKSINELTGSEAPYYEILGFHNMRHANDTKVIGLQKTRMAAKDLVEYIEKCAANNEPPPAEGYQATDEDVPAVIGSAK